MDCVRAGLDGGLGLGVAVEPAENEFDLGFDLREGGLSGFVVDGGTEVEAWEMSDFRMLGSEEKGGLGSRKRAVPSSRAICVDRIILNGV